jgi:ketosteroid isomerase-like protein
MFEGGAMNIKLSLLGVAAWMTFGTAGLAAPVDRQAALDAVVASEHAFARAAAEKGINEAFLAYLADDSILFRPGPVPGKEWQKAQRAGSGLLSWYPVTADVSLAGDLGYTTGPWEFRPSPDAKEAFHGFYVTLWRRQADGSLKAEFDGGSRNGAPPASATEVKIPKADPARVDHPPAVSMMEGKAALLAADRAFAKDAAEKGTGAAFGEHLAGNARLHRDGMFPAVSKPAVLAALGAQPPKMTWEPTHSGISSSGDLGYTLGTEQVDAQKGHYLRIWKKAADGSWKVALDLFTPLPPPPAEKPAEKPKDPAGR